MLCSVSLHFCGTFLTYSMAAITPSPITTWQYCVRVYYSDKAGEIVLSGLEPGTTVKAREIKTVEGFVLDGSAT